LTQSRLGLFDTPPDRRQIRVGLAVAGLVIANLLITLPYRDVPLPEVGAFIPVINAIMLLGELITATLLFAQAGVFRSRALAVLAAGYVFTALLLIPHALTFPGAFAPDGLLGAGVNTTAWLAYVRRIAFPLIVILYVWLKQADAAAQPESEPPAISIGVWLVAATALAAGVTLLATGGHEELPPYYTDHSSLIYSLALWYQSAMFAVIFGAVILLYRKRSSVLDMWLLVALWGLLIETLLVLALQGRFTVGWYSLFVMTLFSHLVVMLALIAESNRLYARLALSTAARTRERDVRLMSMEAMGAALSHEIGQPLTAIVLNAKGGLNSLAKGGPESETLASTLRAILDAGNRSFEIIKSIRAMFTKGPGTSTEFSLNDLARETATLLNRDMAIGKVSLRLALDETLPPILADRVQVQQVIVNLLTNAVESLTATPGRTRRITIRSSLLNDQNLLLEINDTGSGIEADRLEDIFQAFFTTKATGTGLGLSLCKVIAEEHGGRLWASLGHGEGATFYLQLPRSPLSHRDRE
jgi:signal transduction histidine kinase